MTYRIPTLLAVLYVLAATCALWAIDATVGASMARADGPHAVGLSDAATAPSALALLRPGASITYTSEDDGYNCVAASGRGRGWFVEVSAYQWNGRALSAQRWTDHHAVTYWSGRGGRVTFDGITFRNHTRAAVLVAGWCD